MLCVGHPVLAQAAPRASDADAKVAERVRCEAFRKNPDGSWTAAPNTMVGDNDVSGNVFAPGRPSAVGADLAAIVERKCGGRRR